MNYSPSISLSTPFGNYDHKNWLTCNPQWYTDSRGCCGSSRIKKSVPIRSIRENPRAMPNARKEMRYPICEMLHEPTHDYFYRDGNEWASEFSRTLDALGEPVKIFDPSNGLPLSGGVIPASRISPQAKALLAFYPLPNFDGRSRYNYQIPLVGSTHQDSLQAPVVVVP